MVSLAKLIRVSGVRCGVRHVGFLWLITASLSLQASAGGVDFLGDETAGLSVTHRQQWGDFGWNTAAAAAATGTRGTPLRIGDKTFKRGLGHHANGQIDVDLQGRYTAFRASVGVQWQGGNKGSVIFRVVVDGQMVFQSEPMSDSDPAREVDVSLVGARRLRLIAADSADGFACDMANWAEARLVRDPRLPFFSPVSVSLAGRAAPPLSASACGFSMIAAESGPQVAVMEPAKAFTVSVGRGEDVRFVISISNVLEPLRIVAEVAVIRGEQAEVELSIGGKRTVRRVSSGSPLLLAAGPAEVGADADIVIITRGIDGETGVRWRGLRYAIKDRYADVPLQFPRETPQFPPRSLPNPSPAVEQELIEWDWRMQDGIGTDREPRNWKEAVGGVLAAGDLLVRDLAAAGALQADLAGEWDKLRTECNAADTVDGTRWESLWLRVHRLRRRIVFSNPLANVGPLLFVKRVPSCFSHQLTQYYGMCARPGGGLFVLDAPGESMQCRRLAELPAGSCQHPEVSFDGKRVLFSFCEADSAPVDRTARQDRHYHLFEVGADGSNLRQLTDGPYDDFSPRCLPNGKILFLSTRRGGFHRCGAGPCPVYTMAVAEADGSRPRVISFHETHEWDPAVLGDGRIIYTRWDYVDRHAVYYEQLWTAHPDGTNVRAFYGNNTFNPVGIWEAQSVPGSSRVMATAGAHHAMTAGSIILLDVTRGNDGPNPITRLTPDALFPESECRVQNWHAPTGVPSPPPVPVAQRRWPGHCYRTPYPLSEAYFLAAYSFDPLIGEPDANRANMFGIYMVDRFGNKELIYRDAGIGSLWPTPLRSRPRPPVLASIIDEPNKREGTFFLQNVYQSWPKLPAGEPIRRLRILQVLPKTTPHANTPRVGLANASPGKQVLGTVPVEADGSAYFRAPACVPLSFQALDERGMAVQTMRSLTYLQPGEHATCIGCHEDRSRVPELSFSARAMTRPPSPITAGPDGSRPLSYPILVQPLLDAHCTSCHAGPKADGGVVLTGEPQGSFTASYNALAPLVSYSEWKSTPQSNAEPLTYPDRFGARASRLMSLLLGGHEGVKLSAEEIERLATWMDANALFYGTFDPADQLRQQQGKRIAGPALE